MKWSGGLVDWADDNRAYISVVFSWQKQEAYQKAAWIRASGKEVWMGGPAVYNDPCFFDDIAFIAPPIDDVIWKHNQEATFTTRGCLRTCQFCIVPKIEPEYKELKYWPARPIVCDNNILACSDAHFDRVIDQLKPLKNIDFNQGLDARLMTKRHAELLQTLNMKVVRLAWDHTEIENQWMRAFQILIDVGFKPRDIHSYVLIGFNDTPEDALYRLDTIKKLGAIPNPMRYQPLDAIKRNSYIGENWTEAKLKNYMRYWSRQIWLGHIPFEDYDFRKVGKSKPPTCKRKKADI